MKDFRTLMEILKNTYLKYPENNVIREMYPKEKKYTYNELYNDIYNFSNHLRNICGRRIKIGLVLPNGYAWIKSFFSIIASDNVAIPVDINWNYEELVRILNEFDINVVIANDLIDKKLIEKIKFNGITVLYLENLSNNKLTLSEKDRIDNNDCSAIYFTSGTTGRYKAVMISQRNLIQNCISIGDVLKLREGCVLLNVLPFHHSFAIMCDVIYAIYLGATICISDLKRLDRDLIFYSPDYIFAVPLIAENILKYLKIKQKKCINECDSKNQVVGENLEYIICGGAVIRKNLTKDLYNFGIKLIRGYGITECSPVVSIEAWNHDYDDLTVGIPIKCNKVKIVDKEILVKGENVALGYYGDTEEESFIDGWFKTGDLGYIGENGKIYINGRKKNIIILKNGENISIETLESSFVSKGIEREFIIFEEITYTGEHFLAVLFDEVEAPFENFEKKYLQVTNNGKFKVKKIYGLDKKFLKTSTQKINRKKNINRYIRLKLLNEITNILDDFIFQKIDILPEMDLYSDLGLDSLELLRLTLSLEERFDVIIELEDVRLFTNINDILDYFMEQYTNVDDVVLQWKMKM